jgi:glycosyltransferase involved in cell wall biosynthesis
LNSCQFKKVKNFQISAWNNVDLLSATNLKEKYLIEKNVNKNVKIHPNTIDLPLLDEYPKEREPNSLVFMGNYSGIGNEHGIVFFLKKVFPKLIKKNKNIVLYLIGDNPSKRMRAFEKKYASNLKILGWVEDPLIYLTTKTIFICPLFLGGGQRIKLLYALNAKIPIISTENCINEFLNRPIIGKEILKANKPKEFIKEIQSLLKNEYLMEKIGRNGYKFLIRNYHWEKVFKKLEQDLIKTISM